MSRASSSHSLRSSGSFRGERQTSTSSFESEEWKSTCMVSQYTQSSAQPGTIDFRLGQPAPSSLPVELVQTAALSTFGARKDDLCDPLMLQYGVVGGHFDFRAALAQFLMENTHNLEVRAEDLMATAGVSHGIHLCARLLAKPGDVVLMEEPSYPLAAEIFKAAGLRVAGTGVAFGGAPDPCVRARGAAICLRGAMRWKEHSRRWDIVAGRSCHGVRVVRARCKLWVRLGTLLVIIAIASAPWQPSMVKHR